MWIVVVLLSLSSLANSKPILTSLGDDVDLINTPDVDSGENESHIDRRGLDIDLNEWPKQEERALSHVPSGEGATSQVSQSIPSKNVDYSIFTPLQHEVSHSMRHSPETWQQSVQPYDHHKLAPAHVSPYGSVMGSHSFDDGHGSRYGSHYSGDASRFNHMATDFEVYHAVRFEDALLHDRTRNPVHGAWQGSGSQDIESHHPQDMSQAFASTSRPFTSKPSAIIPKRGPVSSMLFSNSHLTSVFFDKKAWKQQRQKELQEEDAIKERARLRAEQAKQAKANLIRDQQNMMMKSKGKGSFRNVKDFKPTEKRRLFERGVLPAPMQHQYEVLNRIIRLARERLEKAAADDVHTYEAQAADLKEDHRRFRGRQNRLYWSGHLQGKEAEQYEQTIRAYGKLRPQGEVWLPEEVLAAMNGEEEFETPMTPADVARIAYDRIEEAGMMENSEERLDILLQTYEDFPNVPRPSSLRRLRYQAWNIFDRWRKGMGRPKRKRQLRGKHHGEQEQLASEAEADLGEIHSESD